jgi:hypothetical protein
MLLCSKCKGPFHPALGHVWTEDTRLCHSCTLNFIKWLKAREAQMSRVKKGMKTSFTQAALTSNIPKE